jgi:hypothetical protein
VVGDGRKIHFWEDTWFGTAPLAVQFWDMYTICNKKSKKFSKIWVDGELRLTFRITFSNEMMQICQELCAVVEDVRLGYESDTLVWCYTKSRTYTTQSFYVVINYRGITPMYIRAIWSIIVPTKIHLFLWLLSHNKLATVDNLNRKGLSKPIQCKFCDEHESISHSFFECVVVKAVWYYVNDFLNMTVGADYISIASKWLSRDKYYVANTISAAVLRGIWLIRNEFVFHNLVWADVKMVLRKVLTLIVEWRPIYKATKVEAMERWCTFLEQKLKEPLTITNG